MIAFVAIGAVLFWVSVIALALSAAGSATQVISAKKVLIGGSGDDTVLCIEGRAVGFLPWLTGLIGIGWDTTFVVDGNGASKRRQSIFGGGSAFIPVERLSSASSGYRNQPIAKLFGVAFGLLAIAFAVGALNANSYYDSDRKIALLLATFLLSLFSVGSLINSKYGRRVWVDVRASDGTALGVTFAASILDGTHLDASFGERAASVLNAFIREAQKKK